MTISKFLVQKLEPNIRGFSRDFKGARGYKDTSFAFVTDTYIYIYFSQNQNEFGCFDAAVLLLVSRFLKN